MIEVILAIITDNFEEIKEKMKLAEPYAKWIQIDVGDGEFVPNKTFLDLDRFSEIETPLEKEAHLMVKDPKNYIERCEEGGFQRVIFHIEAIQTDTDKGRTGADFVPEIIEDIKSKGMEAGIALNPETPIEAAEPFIDKTDVILFLGVNPGFSGQKFLPEVASKIKILRQKYPDVNIAIDGGMNPENAKKAIEAGANIIVSASYIWGSGDVGGAIEELKS